MRQIFALLVVCGFLAGTIAGCGGGGEKVKMPDSRKVGPPPGAAGANPKPQKNDRPD